MIPAPTICRVVVFSDEKGNESPAIVTYVWPQMGGPGGINCHVFSDCMAPFWKSSVPHKSVAPRDSMCWDWPKRDRNDA